MSRPETSTAGAGRGAYLSLARVLSSALALVQLSILARLLESDQFALAAAAVAVATYLQLLPEPLIAGYERLGHHDLREDLKAGLPRSAVRAALATLAAIGPVVGTAVGFISGRPVLAFATSLWVVSMVQFRWASVQLLNWNLPTKYGSLLLANSAARAIGVAVGAAYFGSASGSLGLGATASMVAVVLVSPRGGSWSLDSRLMKQVLVVGLPLGIAAAASTSMSSWPTLAASQNLSDASFASYSAQMSLFTAGYGATLGFFILFGFPRAKRAWDGGNLQGALLVEMRFLRVLAILGPIGCGLSWLFGDKLTSWLLGSQYAGRTIPTMAFAIGCLSSIFVIRSWLLRLNYRQRSVAVIMVVGAIIQVPLVWWGVKAHGVIGLLVAVGTVLSAQAFTVSSFTRGGSRWMADALTLSMLCLIMIVAVLGAD